jgi:hypothetical protein
MQSNILKIGKVKPAIYIIVFFMINTILSCRKELHKNAIIIKDWYRDLFTPERKGLQSLQSGESFLFSNRNKCFRGLYNINNM